jgi:hypothetical protein
MNDIFERIEAECGDLEEQVYYHDLYESIDYHEHEQEMRK